MLNPDKASADDVINAAYYLSEKWQLPWKTLLCNVGAINKTKLENVLQRDDRCIEQYADANS